MVDGQYATDLMGQIEEGMKKYSSSDHSDPSGVMDYHKNDMYQDDDPLNQDYQKIEEEEEKKEELQEFEEDDPKYDTNADDDDDFLKKDGDDSWQQWQRKKSPIQKKTKSTIEDAVLKAQEDIATMD